jgi:hypothetical protein
MVLRYMLQVTCSPDGVRTGNMQMHKDLPVQSLFKGCRLTSDGTIKYFNATDWDHFGNYLS